MIQKLKHRYQFELEVKVIKKGSPGERIGFRTSRSQMFFKIGVLKNFANFPGKHKNNLQAWKPVKACNYIKRDFDSCWIFKIVKKSYFEKQLVFSNESGTKTGPSVSNKYQIQLTKSICCRENQHLSEGRYLYQREVVPGSLHLFKPLSILNLAMAKWRSSQRMCSV